MAKGGLKKAINNHKALQKQKKAHKEESKVKKKSFRYKLEIVDSDKVLFVGEGNFSFSNVFAIKYLDATNFTCTCFDSEETINEKYPDAVENIQNILDLEGKVIYGVDCTKFDKRIKKYDKIIFNFPHVGLGIKDQNRNVEANQELLLKFFQACKKALLAKGIVAVTIKNGLPYDLWDIKKLARACGYKTERSMDFVADDYPGYFHRRTIGYNESISKSDNSEISNSKMYLFSLNE
ncbi:hypothetical protein HDV01_001459 [Terramyces sp. JEL0728]|nr:hypothetical protein HDV01_001459 [Terramyces sp. JEL0728]